MGEDAPPRRDDAGVTAPEESSPIKEFLLNEIPFVIFKCCVTVRAKDVIPLQLGAVIRGGKEMDSDIGELLFSSSWEDESRSGGGGGGNLFACSC